MAWREKPLVNFSSGATGHAGPAGPEKFFLHNGIALSVQSGDITKMAGAVLVVGEDDEFSGNGAVAKAVIRAGGDPYRVGRDALKRQIQKEGREHRVYRCIAGPCLQFYDVFHAMTLYRGLDFSYWDSHLEDLFHSIGVTADGVMHNNVFTPLLGAGMARGTVNVSLQAAVNGLSKLATKYLKEVIIVEFDPSKAAEIRGKLRQIFSQNVQRQQGEWGESGRGTGGNFPGNPNESARGHSAGGQAVTNQPQTWPTGSGEGSMSQGAWYNNSGQTEQGGAGERGQPSSHHGVSTSSPQQHGGNPQASPTDIPQATLVNIEEEFDNFFDGRQNQNPNQKSSAKDTSAPSGSTNQFNSEATSQYAGRGRGLLVQMNKDGSPTDGTVGRGPRPGENSSNLFYEGSWVDEHFGDVARTQGPNQSSSNRNSRSKRESEQTSAGKNRGGGNQHPGGDGPGGQGREGGSPEAGRGATLGAAGDGEGRRPGGKDGGSGRGSGGAPESGNRGVTKEGQDPILAKNASPRGGAGVGSGGGDILALGFGRGRGIDASSTKGRETADNFRSKKTTTNPSESPGAGDDTGRDRHGKGSRLSPPLQDVGSDGTAVQNRAATGSGRGVGLGKGGDDRSATGTGGRGLNDPRKDGAGGGSAGSGGGNRSKATRDGQTSREDGRDVERQTATTLRKQDGSTTTTSSTRNSSLNATERTRKKGTGGDGQGSQGGGKSFDDRVADDRRGADVREGKGDNPPPIQASPIIKPPSFTAPRLGNRDTGSSGEPPSSTAQHSVRGEASESDEEERAVGPEEGKERASPAKTSTRPSGTNTERRDTGQGEANARRVDHAREKTGGQPDASVYSSTRSPERVGAGETTRGSGYIISTTARNTPSNLSGGRKVLEPQPGGSGPPWKSNADRPAGSQGDGEHPGAGKEEEEISNDYTSPARSSEAASQSGQQTEADLLEDARSREKANDPNRAGRSEREGKDEEKNAKKSRKERKRKGKQAYYSRVPQHSPAGREQETPAEEPYMEKAGIAGSMPDGKMVVSTKPQLQLQGFPDCGTILIEYSFPNGTQGSNHPAPGQPYKGTFRRAYIPDNQEGRRVLDLLQNAFDRKLTFQLVQSGPDQEWEVEFADIPHKTSLRGGPERKGYPDPDYLSDVMGVLANPGVRADFPGEPATAQGEAEQHEEDPGTWEEARRDNKADEDDTEGGDRNVNNVPEETGEVGTRGDAGCEPPSDVDTLEEQDDGEKITLASGAEEEHLEKRECMPAERGVVNIEHGREHGVQQDVPVMVWNSSDGTTAADNKTWTSSNIEGTPSALPTPSPSDERKAPSKQKPPSSRNAAISSLQAYKGEAENPQSDQSTPETLSATENDGPSGKDNTSGQRKREPHTDNPIESKSASTPEEPPEEPSNPEDKDSTSGEEKGESHTDTPTESGATTTLVRDPQESANAEGRDSTSGQRKRKTQTGTPTASGVPTTPGGDPEESANAGGKDSTSEQRKRETQTGTPTASGVPTTPGEDPDESLDPEKVTDKTTQPPPKEPGGPEEEEGETNAKHDDPVAGDEKQQTESDRPETDSEAGRQEEENVSRKDQEAASEKVGNMPPGKMRASKQDKIDVPGYKGCGVIIIDYIIPNGEQGAGHPQPGSPYCGCVERAYLPGNQEGRRVLHLLKKAFDRKLTFQLVQSGPDQEWEVEFADIPHKTSLRGGPERGGYPDPGYLECVQKLLRDNYGIE